MTANLKVLDLFSGFGMFSLGLHRAGGFETVAFCEISEYPRKVLNARYPGVKIYEDVCALTPERLATDGIAPNVICGGFPCQDLSVAGKGAGLDGKRSGLYREVIRLARDIRPKFIILENVAALLDRGLGVVLGDLAEIGYDAEWHCIPASYIGAWHRRDRVWLVAYPRSVKQQQRLAEPLFRQSDLQGQPSRGIEGWPGRPNLPSPRVCGKDDGPPNLVERIHGLGNGLHPGIAERIGRAVLRATA
jgi:DNA (cytosine-5)-methyltransferase 1